MTDSNAYRDQSAACKPSQSSGQEAGQPTDEPLPSSTGDSVPEDATAEEATIADMAAELESLRAELAAEHDKLLRALADLENVRRRARDEMARTVDQANEHLLRDLLPIVDDLERALESAASSPSLREGLKMILKNLLAVMAAHGAEPMTVVGEAFDPYQHEAVECVVTEEVPEHTVVGELQRGYKYRDRLLRPAKVRVSTLPE